MYVIMNHGHFDIRHVVFGNVCKWRMADFFTVFLVMS